MGQQHALVSQAPIVQQKLAQASALLAAAGVDAWLIVSPDGRDPALPLVVGGPPVSRRGFFLVTASGAAYAAVHSIDVAELESAGGYTVVLPYLEDMWAALSTLLRHADLPTRLALNDDPYDPAWNGLSYGRYRWLRGVLDAIGFRGELVSARPVLAPLRAVKLPDEQARLIRAAEITDQIAAEVETALNMRLTEREVQQLFLERMRAHGVRPTAEGPIVGFGGPGYTTHREPGDRRAAPGDQLMVDFGVEFEGYCSDISRTFYFLRPGESEPPAALRRLFDAHRAAINAALGVMRPGVLGWQVDAVARDVVRQAGYPEFEHALGHQLGLMAHDGGTLLAPRWERYGDMPNGALAAGEIYTLEPTIITSDGLVCQFEEEVLIQADGPRVITQRLTGMVSLSRS